MKKKKMKIIIQIIGILLLSQIAVGQTNATKEVIAYLKSKEFSVDSLKSILKISDFNNGNWSVEKELQKEISVWHYFEREIEFKNQQFIIIYQDQANFSDYTISVQYLNEKALIILVNEEGFTKNREIIKYVSRDFSQFLIDYNKRFKTSLKLNKIQIDYLTLYEFGYACSVSGSPTEKFFEMMKSVNKKQDKKLTQWLTSLNINLRLFGAIGLKWLERGGRELTPNESMLINKLRNDNYLINSCSGCSFPNNESIKSLMDDISLLEFYNEYKKMGWFK